MRKSLGAAAVAFTLLTSLSGNAAAQSAQKFAYIESKVIFDQAPGRAAAEAQFNREMDLFRGIIKAMSDSLEALNASAGRQPSQTPAQRDAWNKHLQSTQARYEARAKDLEASIGRRQTELVQPILDRIKPAIEAVRVEGGYSFIFNADVEGSPIAARDPNLNVTDRVLAKLRKG